nr:uncharacterized protein LOC107445443 [Parasteatoda tepidariorum]
MKFNRYPLFIFFLFTNYVHMDTHEDYRFIAEIYSLHPPILKHSLETILKRDYTFLVRAILYGGATATLTNASRLENGLEVPSHRCKFRRVVFLLGKTTMRNIVRETCKHLWTVLAPIFMAPKTEED